MSQALFASRETQIVPFQGSGAGKEKPVIVYETIQEIPASDYAEVDCVQRASEDSFPASDPPAWTSAKV